MIDRRTAVTALLSIIGAAKIAGGQTARSSGKMGYIHPVTISPSHISFSILQPAWQRLGYVEGETVLPRSADGDARRLPGLVTDLITHGAGVLIVVGADAVRAAARTTRTTPIVAIDLETDPIRSGVAASYARPGGNVTGLFLDLPTLAGKWIQLLREVDPFLERIAISWDPTTGTEQLDIARDAAKSLDIEAVVFETPPSGEFEQAFERLGRGKRTGIIQLTSPGFATRAAEFAAAALKRQLPTMAFLKGHARSGMLMSYGPLVEEYFPRAVVIADQILKGERAGDIPIERPMRFELAVNMNTAKALGLTIPPSILLRADEVIE